MSADLEEILTCLRGTESDKIRERQRCISRLQILLEKNSLQAALDQNSKRGPDGKLLRHEGIISWETVFKGVRNLVNRELENVQKGKSSDSTKESRVASIGSLMKMTIRNADARGPKLNGQDLMHHIITIFDGVHSSSILSTDYSNILLHNVLYIQQYVVDVKPNTWITLLDTCWKLLTDPRGASRLVLSQIISLTMKKSQTQITIPCQNLFKKFTELFQNIRQNKSIQFAENMVTALNRFSLAVNKHSWMQLCKLGEDIHHNLLYLWASRPSQTLKEELMKFWCIQMSTHHPSGARTVEEGALAIDSKMWKAHLHKLYDILYSDVQEITMRCKFHSQKETILSRVQLDLIAHICHQLFMDETSVLDVTQLFQSDEFAFPSSKKRRLETGWEVLLTLLESYNLRMQILPWLQIWIAICNKYPADIPSDVILKLINILHSLLKETKRVNVTVWFLRCLKEIAANWANIQTDTISNESVSEIWMKIADSVIRLVSVQHATDECYSFLNMVIRNHLIASKTEFFTVIHHCTILTMDTIQYMYAAVTNFDIPDGALSDKKSDRFGLRKQFLELLLPKPVNDDCDYEDDLEGNGMGTIHSLYFSSCASSLRILSDTVIALILKDPYGCSSLCKHDPVHNEDALMLAYQKKEDEVFFDEIQAMEKLYRKCTFREIPPYSCTITVQKHSICPEVGKANIASLVKDIENKIIMNARYVLDERFQGKKQTLIEIMKHTELLLLLIGNFLKYGVYSAQELSQTAYIDTIKALMKGLFSELLKVMDTKQGYPEIVPRLISIYSIPYVIDVDESGKDFISKVLATLTDKKVIKLLMHRVEKVLSPVTSVCRSDPFDITQPDSTDHFMSEKRDQSELESSTSSVNHSLSVLDISHLNSEERECLDLCKVIIMWCNLLGDDNFITAASDFMEKIFYLLSADHFQSANPLHLQLYCCVTETLVCTNSVLSADDLGNVLDTLRVVLKNYRQNVLVCCKSLELLLILIPHLRNSDNVDILVNDDKKNDARNISMILLNLLRDIHSTTNCATSLRLLIHQCTAEFLKLDPEGHWTHGNFRATEKRVALMKKIPDALKDTSHSVRVFVASEIIPLLFLKDKPVCDHMTQHLPQGKQELAFTIINAAIQGMLAIQSELAEKEKCDEKNNWNSGVLLTLASVIKTSIVCRKRALFILIGLLNMKEFNDKCIKKVLVSIAKHLGYEDHVQFLHVNLPFLVEKWLHEKYCLLNFPWSLFNCSNDVEFIKCYVDKLIPAVVMIEDKTSLDLIAEKMLVDTTELLKSMLPKIVVHILPWFAVNQFKLGIDSSNSPDVHMATIAYSSVEALVGQKAFESAIANHMDELVVDILMTLSPFAGENTDVPLHIRVVMPEPNPPCFSPKIVTATMEFLTQGHLSRATSLVNLLAKSQDGIQKVLLSLHVHMVKCHDVSEKYRIILMYSLFVDLLLSESMSNLAGSWHFIMRDVIFTLVHLIRDLSRMERRCIFARESLLKACLILKSLSITAISNTPDDFGEHFPVIVSCFVALIKSNSYASQKSLELLRYLIVENSTILSSAISLLNPFPNSPDFQELNDVRKQHSHHLASNFEQILHAFLYTPCFHGINDEDDNGLVECLNALCHELSDSEHCRKLASKNHRLLELVSKLIFLTRSNSETVKIYASRCLGEIGPLNLGITSLRFPEVNADLAIAMQLYSSNSEIKRNAVIFHTLNDYLTNPSIDTLTASSNVLKKILAIPAIASNFITEYQTHLPDKLFIYLNPFCLKKKTNTQIQKNSLPGGGIEILDSDVLWVPSFSSHDQWLKHLVCTIIDSGLLCDKVLQYLKPICEVQVAFCELILPYLIHDILLQDIEIYKDVLSHHIRTFFSKHCDYAVKESCRATTQCFDNCTDETSICKNKKSVSTLLHVVQYLRLQNVPKRGRSLPTSWENNFWLDLEYLHLAKAAKTCGKHFSTVLYAEIWCCSMRNHDEASQHSYSDSQSTTSELNTLSEENQGELQTLLVDAYRSIGDPDGVYSYCTGRLANTFSRIQTYEQENDWHKALTAYDMEMVIPRMTAQIGLLQALQRFGTGHILDTYLVGLCSQGLSESKEIKEFQFENAWKTSCWDLPSNLRINRDCPYNQSVYTSLTGLRDRDENLHTEALRFARLQVLSDLDACSTESVKNLSHLLAKLQCLTCIGDAGNVIFKNEKFMKVFSKWNDQMECIQEDFEYQETLICCQCSLLRLLHDLSKEKVFYSSLTSCLKAQAHKARVAARFQIADQALHQLKQLEQPELSWELRLEEARLYWSKGEKEVAKSMLYVSLNILKQKQNINSDLAQTFAESLVTYGTWLSESRSENPNCIIENYLEKAVAILLGIKQSENSPLAIKAFLTLARYADGQYQNIVNYMKSSIYEAKRAMIEESKAHVQKLTEMKDNGRYHKTLQKQSVLDAQEMKSLQEDKNKFLVCATQNYLRCLQQGDEYDFRIFRLISMWLENPANIDVIKTIREASETIQSHKFLPLMYQLAARMSQTEDDSQTILQKIIKKAAVDHPYHTLYIILALAHAKKDSDFISKLAGDIGANEETCRVLAAKNIIAQLKSSKCAGVLSNIEKLCVAYIQLANINVQKYKNHPGSKNFPPGVKLVSIKELTNVPVPTMDLPIDPSCCYDNIIYVASYQPKFQLAGGINLPKIITCVGSDGKARKQLVKGKDDLRQDAVMQQVFGMVNTLLHKEQETRNRRLLVRTYKVIPMTQRCGILEWCEGTIPIGTYLIGQDGAHGRYEPKDWGADKCRGLLVNAHSIETYDGILKTYINISKHFKPVFRHFFLEKFPDPAQWYKGRLAYTRSVATNSIVGYILGLGDRHTQNILIDCSSAELIHIDLGVAFEQGKILPTPETVPFRLTRDIVDGMGVAGVEGVFRRCCEKMMHVMHQNKDALMTIVEVLLYDPIYTWTISPMKAYLLQHKKERGDGDDDDISSGDTLVISNISKPKSIGKQDVNKMSERVLLRLEQKLQGIEDGVQLSIQGQVNMLIQEAMDLKNLCRLFPGWQAYI